MTASAPRPHLADVPDEEIALGVPGLLTFAFSPLIPMDPGRPDYVPSAGDRATWLRTAELFMDEQARRAATS